MVRTFHVLSVFVLLALLVALRVPYVVRAGGSASAPATLSDAVQTLAHPPGAGVLGSVDARRPFLPAALLSGLYHAAIASGVAGAGIGDGPSFAAKIANGSPLAMRIGGVAWLGVEIVGLLSLGLLSRRLARRLELPAWSASLGVALVVCVPIAITGARRLDGALLASALAFIGLLTATAKAAPTDHPRWILGGVLIGSAAAVHPVGVAFLPLLALAFAWHPGGAGATRVGVALLPAVVGALIGDPRLVEHPAGLLERFRVEMLAPRALGHLVPLEQLARGVTPAVVAFALGGVALLWRRAAGGRAVALALASPCAIVLALPAAGHSAVVLVAPLVAMLAALGAGAFVASLSKARARMLAPALAGALLAWPVVLSVGEGAAARRGESRAAAAAWLRAELPEAARVVTDFYGPDIPRAHVTFTLPFNPERPEVYAGAYEIGWYDGFDTFVLVGTQTERYRRDPERHAAQLSFIARLRVVCDEIARFDRKNHAGPTVTVLRRRGEPSGADLRQLLRRLPPDPAVPDFYLSLGGSYQRMGDLDVAKSFLTIAAHLAPGDPRLAVNLSSIYIKEGEYMLADSLLKTVVHANPTVPKLRYQLGLVKQERRLFGDAIGEYKMAVRYDPTYVEAYFNLGACYLEVGNLSGARSAFRRVIELGGQGSLRTEAERMLGELDTS